MENNNQVDALISYNVSEAAIAELKEQYGSLVVAGEEDKDGYEVIKRARIEVRTYRMAVEERRKELKAQFLEGGRKVDSAAKVLMEPLKALETHLVEQENIVAHAERRRQEAEAAALAELCRERFTKLQSVQGGAFTPDQLGCMSQEQFDKVFTDAEALYTAAQLKAQEDAKRLALLEQERKEQEAEQRRLAEENRKLQAQVIAQKEKELRDEQERTLQLQREQKKAADLIEQQRQIEEAQRRKLLAEAADKEMMQHVMSKFDTLELCWTEIVRLRKLILGKQ